MNDIFEILEDVILGRVSDYFFGSFNLDFIISKTKAQKITNSSIKLKLSLPDCITAICYS